RLVGLALACSTDHRIPLVSSAVAGNTPDVKVFEAALPKLISRLEALGVEPASITVVFDKGNYSRDNLAAVADSEVGVVGPPVPTQHADLLAVTDDAFHAVEGLDGVVSYLCELEMGATT